MKFYGLTLYTPTSQNGQKHSNNSSAVADKFFECVWPFCGVGAYRVKSLAPECDYICVRFNQALESSDIAG